MGSTGLFLPHETFATLYHKYPSHFRTCVVPSSAELERFWFEMEDNPFFIDHPCRGRDNFRSLCVPVSLHGDGVPVTGVGKSWSQSMEVVHWCSTLCADMFGLFSNFLIWACFEDAISEVDGADTMYNFWKKISWSFYWLNRGKLQPR